MGWTTKADLDRWFGPTPAAAAASPKVRAKALELASAILDDTRQCADQSAAVRCLREALHWAGDAGRAF